MVRLIDVTQAALNTVKMSTDTAGQYRGTEDTAVGREGPPTPKWITPMLLFIDLYEKVGNWGLKA